jgi:hypothetical protein
VLLLPLVVGGRASSSTPFWPIVTVLCQRTELAVALLAGWLAGEWVPAAVGCLPPPPDRDTAIAITIAAPIAAAASSHVRVRRRGGRGGGGPVCRDPAAVGGARRPAILVGPPAAPNRKLAVLAAGPTGMGRRSPPETISVGGAGSSAA